jgi:hypothetical protein
MKNARSVMRARRRWKSVLIVVALMLSGTAAAADTAVATRWRPLGEAQSDCLAHAQMAIFRSGFDPATGGSETMSGKKGDYTASIRCVATQRVVFFVLSGPSPDVTTRYLDVLFGHF